MTGYVTRQPMPQELHGTYQCAAHKEVPDRFAVSEDSFDGSRDVHQRFEVRTCGELKLVNTIEAFRKADKQGLLNRAAAKVIKRIV